MATVHAISSTPADLVIRRVKSRRALSKTTARMHVVMLLAVIAGPRVGGLQKLEANPDGGAAIGKVDMSSVCRMELAMMSVAIQYNWPMR